MNKFILYTAAICLALSIHSGAVAQEKRIAFKAKELYPEGVAFDQKRNVFYVSSVRRGTIGKVDMQGKYTELLADSGLVASFGMKVDPASDRLWVCLADQKPLYSIYTNPATLKKLARVVAIDLKTGRKMADIDLGKLYNGPHFLNDLTMDKSGNLYITDSFSPVIYQIDKSGKASVFATSDLFKSPGVGLNGIVWHPGGFLLAVNNGSGTLLKVDIKDPKKISLVMSDQIFSGGDGLLLDTQNNLVLAQNKGTNAVFCIGSTDLWKTAKVLAATDAYARLNFPSTLTREGKQTWVLNAKLNELKEKNNPPPSDEFILQMISF
ncbi:MAG: SMP-30/gluconolactonase/LRE family protein [Mucilaginibacter polytrichastri]|nr:SMP-30/gluconolactonase/LRE family protein [Mucilaginibacter polytrichastri]